MEFIWLDFLHSDWHDYRVSGRNEDRLRQPDWLADFLRGWKLEAALPADEPTLTDLTTLRSLLQQIVSDLAQSRPIAPDKLATLNEYLARTPLTRKLSSTSESYRMEFEPLATEVKNWNWVIEVIATTFADFLTSYEPGRVRICANPDCRWVFYDHSRNHTQRWCDNPCATLVKVRRFRQRRKTGTEGI